MMMNKWIEMQVTPEVQSTVLESKLGIRSVVSLSCIPPSRIAYMFSYGEAGSGLFCMGRVEIPSSFFLGPVYLSLRCIAKFWLLAKGELGPGDVEGGRLIFCMYAICKGLLAI